MFLVFLSSGLFLGWSLGANDASNVFGTAVASRMVAFRTAAICCSIFIILGAVISGAGASETLGRLGAVDALAGAFIVALAAGASVYLMTRARYPVSTSQAIVGAIIGWNLFSDSATDMTTLYRIAGSWVACPLIAAVAAIGLYRLAAVSIRFFRPHILSLDTLTRVGLVFVGAFGAYSLGANNIANVMGVFVAASPLQTVPVFGSLHFTATQQLFLIGGVAIAVGVATYSRNVMTTVGAGITRLSPVAALVVVLSHSIVLFIFASQGLEQLLKDAGLPTIPLVPVSSSQAIVGAVIGIGLLRGTHNIRWKLVGGIMGGWLATPVIAAVISFVLLFIAQNVFEQKVYDPGAARFGCLQQGGVLRPAQSLPCAVFQRGPRSAGERADACPYWVRLPASKSRLPVDTDSQRVSKKTAAAPLQPSIAVPDPAGTPLRTDPVLQTGGEHESAESRN